MHEFKYVGEDLCCEGLKVADVATQLGTPLYLYSYKTLVDHYRKLRDAFREVQPLICFSMKANSNLALCKALVKEGAGLDIVSGGELYKALRIGVDPKKIVYASVGKTPQEIEYALQAEILLFNIESLPELEIVDRISGQLKRRAEVSIRLNPDIDPETHTYITTARGGDKFGVDLETAEQMFLGASDFPNLDLVGVHLHIGSQIVDSEPYVAAISKAISLIKGLGKKGSRLQWLNIGGGFGIVYHKEKPQTAQELAKYVLPLLKESNLKIILEPGRFIAGNSGILVTKVLYVKETPAKNFIIIDAGMNDLIRPSLYDAYHEILPVRKEAEFAKYLVADVVGPICESADFIAMDRKLLKVKSGDLLAVMGAGAYGFSMSSNYNSRPRAAEALVMEGKFCLIKERERYEDLIKGESIPEALL